MEQTDQTRVGTVSSRERLQEDYLSVKEAARIIGVSERSIYGYIQDGKLTGTRFEDSIVVRTEEVHAYQRTAPGRLRSVNPRWHQAPLGNRQYLTTITAHIHSGQYEVLNQKLAEIRSAGKHLLPGTTARYLVQDQHHPDEVQLVLVWRSAVMPPTEQREAALASLYDELAGILDWEAASVTEGEVLMHA
jgi:excisionase family DNA binding protein